MFIILGAGGFLGYSLACELNRLHQAYATVSRSFQWEPFASEQRFLSPVSSVDTYSQCIADDSIVIYMAGSTDLVYAEANEVSDLEKHKDQMRSFFSAFHESSCIPSRFIFFSSAGTVYGDANGIPADENQLLQPKSAYGRRNVVLEGLFCDLVHSLDKHPYIFRISNPFGPSQFLFRRKGLIQSLITSSLTNSIVTLRANGLQSRDYICSGQLSRAVVEAATLSDMPQFLNFSSGFSFSAVDIVQLLETIGVSPKIQLSSGSLHYEVQDSLVSCARLCSCLSLRNDHFYPFFEERLEEMIDVTRRSV